MSKQPVFALIDCDNFFVSCERAFRPDLWGKPVAVLSNNDGCIVARSNEVKALGVPMGIPYFKVKDILTKHNVTLFSGNFSLYGDFSQRVVRILQAACPTIEVYSVDESFLELSQLPVDNYEQWARQLRQKIWMWLGVPVSIGVAPTKTLAKAAVEKAKKTPEMGGVCALMTPKTWEALLQQMPVGDVWGVGWRTAPKLQNHGITTAYALAQTPEKWVLKNLTIRGYNTVRELNGRACYGLEEDKPQQSLAVTRTFGHKVRAWHELESAVASFAARAAMRLRRQKQVAGGVAVFIAGDRHRDEVYRRVSTVTTLLQPSNNTGTVITAALEALQKLYDPDFGYRRAGVLLLDLSPAETPQLSWLVKDAATMVERQKRLMQAMDGLNTKYKTTILWHASEQRHKKDMEWLSVKQRRSPAYTTQWNSLPKVR